MVEILERAIAEGGTTLLDFTDGAGREGEFQGASAMVLIYRNQARDAFPFLELRPD